LPGIWLFLRPSPKEQRDAPLSADGGLSTSCAAKSYAGILAFTVVATALLELGWRPVFFAAWDFWSGCALALADLWIFLGAAVGLARLAPTQDLPRFLRGAINSFAVYGAILGVWGLLRISPNATVGENIESVALPLVLSVPLALISALGDLFDKRSATYPLRHSQAIKSLIFAAVACFVFLSVPRPTATARLDVIAAFGSERASMRIGVLHSPVMTLGFIKVGPVGKENLLFLDREEWLRFSQTCARARREASADGQRIDEIVDGGTSARTRLAVIAALNTRFVASSSLQSVTTFELATADQARFDGALNQVASVLSR
jgi:hypothetical protein